MKDLEKIINLSSPILITGETGTGKSTLAREIFNKAKINKEKFIVINLANVKDELIESELFGHKKGAFTGALENKVGFLKFCGKGTIFLDEIGELSLSSQKKLLGVLEEKKYFPLGGLQEENFEGRFIFATNKNLKKMVADGLFREDLFYRISVFECHQPSLRSDRKQIDELIKICLEHFSKKYQKEKIFLREDLLDFLYDYQWPGNIRELKNCFEYMIALCCEDGLKKDDLPPWIETEQCDQRNGNLSSLLESFEKDILLKNLEKNKGKILKTARSLGISKATLIAKNKKHGINSSKIRAMETLFAA